MRINFKNPICYYLIFLLISIFYIYYQTLDNPLIFDDVAASNLGKYSFRYIIDRVFENKLVFGRVLTNYSFLLTWDFGIVANRSINIIFHILNSILLYVFLTRLYSKETAAIVSLFFAVNPAAIYVVCYLVQRSQLLMFFFGVLQCMFFISALTVKRFWISPLFFLFSLLSYKFAIISKEHALPLAIIFPLFCIVYKDNWRRSLVYGLPSLVLLVFASLKALPSIKALGASPMIFEYWQNVSANACLAFSDSNDLLIRSQLTQSSLFFKYFFHWLLPLPTSIDMRVPFVESLNEWWRALPLMLCIIMAVFLIFKKSTRWLGCSILIVVCLFLTELSKVRGGEIFVLYRSYIYALGYMIFLGWFVERVNKKVLLIPLLIITMIVTHYRVQVFDSAVNVWIDAAKKIDINDARVSCQGARAFNNAGTALIKEQKVHEAVEYFEQTIIINHDWIVPVSNLALSFYLLGRYDEAIPLLERVVKEGDREDMINNATKILNKINNATERE